MRSFHHLSSRLVKRFREQKIRAGELPIALKFNRRLNSITIKPYAKLQRDTNVLTPNLADPRLHKTCKNSALRLLKLPLVSDHLSEC